MKKENRYVAWVKTSGDPKWYTNHKVWSSYAEAFEHGQNKFTYCSQFEQFCAVREGVNPNHK